MLGTIPWKARNALVLEEIYADVKDCPSTQIECQTHIFRDFRDYRRTEVKDCGLSGRAQQTPVANGLSYVWGASLAEFLA